MCNAERTPGPDAAVTLREITKENHLEVLRLEVTKVQEEFVAPNSFSIAQAHFTEEAWFRGIYADDVAVGFVMLWDEPEKPVYFLWRFMIDAKHQGKGFGRRAMELLIEHVRTRPNASELLLTYKKGEGGPEGFYVGLGFEHTGKVHDGEIEMRLGLS